MPDAALLDLFQRLAMALGIGFLVGVERGWTHREAPDQSRAAGLRTHAIIGLMGGVVGALTPVIGSIGFAALSLGFAAALLAFKLRETDRDQDISVTGTMAALLVFALGAYAVLGNMNIAAAAGVTLAGLLAFKTGLHDWLGKLTWKELRSALLILAATAIALPLLPDRAIDPWGAINPRELWLLTILVAGASFAGYVGVRILGRDVGELAGATVGALVSSTIVTAELGRRVKAGETSAVQAAAAATLAAAVSVTRVGLLVSATAAVVALEIAPALAAGALSFAAAAFAMRGLARGGGGAPEDKLRSPLYLSSVAAFALLLGALIIIGRVIASAYGQAGLLPFAATAGLADVDAVALAAGSLVRGGLAPGVGAHAILVAVLVNTFSKGAIAIFTGGWRYGALYFGAASAAATAAVLAWFYATPMLAALFAARAAL